MCIRGETNDWIFQGLLPWESINKMIIKTALGIKRSVPHNNEKSNHLYETYCRQIPNSLQLLS